MHDAVDAGDDFLHRGHVGEVGGNEGFIGGKVGGLAHVAPANLRIVRGQHFAQPRADAARRAGDENFLHEGLTDGWD